MQALILAAGYATRLYPLTENTPKPLLKVGNNTIIEHILIELEKVPGLNQAYIVTNDKFYPDFVNWSKNIKTSFRLKILNDGTLSNEDRLGAVGDIHFAVEQEMIDDDLLVIAGDNLFGFSLSKFVHFFQEKKTSIVAFRDLKDKEKVKGKFGVGIVQGSKVIDFEEKPLQPKSSLASTFCYLFPKNFLSQLHSYIKRGEIDNGGDLIRWLVRNDQVHAFVFEEHWFDVGTFESLEEAKRVYKNEN